MFLACMQLHSSCTSSNLTALQDVSEGVTCITVGEVGGSGGEALAFVGGNCSVQGFDARGEERLWTVTGGTVTAMALCDVDNNGQQELVVCDV
jgi:Bardet-Biedl syndrome 2 protein